MQNKKFLTFKAKLVQKHDNILEKGRMINGIMLLQDFIEDNIESLEKYYENQLHNHNLTKHLGDHHTHDHYHGAKSANQSLPSIKDHKIYKQRLLKKRLLDHIEKRLTGRFIKSRHWRVDCINEFLQKNKD